MVSSSVSQKNPQGFWYFPCQLRGAVEISTMSLDPVSSINATHWYLVFRSWWRGSGERAQRPFIPAHAKNFLAGFVCNVHVPAVHNVCIKDKTEPKKLPFYYHKRTPKCTCIMTCRHQRSSSNHTSMDVSVQFNKLVQLGTINCCASSSLRIFRKKSMLTT